MENGQVQPNTTSNMLFRFVYFLFRLVILGLIVFLTATYVPTTEISLNVRLLISLLVMATFGMLIIMSRPEIGFCNYLC